MARHKLEKSENYMISHSLYRINPSLNIAYHQTNGSGPGIIFLCGHGSDMDGSKALFLESWATAQGRAFLRFDYSGHGQSGGDFLDTNISDWTHDTISVIDALTAGPQILVGSSLGGWLMLNAALARPDRVAALVGIAAAPDFTKDLIWDPLTAEQQKKFIADGQIAINNPYADDPVVYPYHLITDGRKHLVLSGQLPIRQPVRLLHGMADTEVPWQTAVRLATVLTSDDVQLYVDKTAGHRFSKPAQLKLLQVVLQELINDLAVG